MKGLVLAVLLVLPLLLSSQSVVCAQENLTLENIAYQLSLLENRLNQRIGSLENSLYLLGVKLENLRIRMSSLENYISDIMDLLNLFTPSVPAAGVSVSVVYSEGGKLLAKQVSQGLENILTVEPGVVIVQVKKPDGTPSVGLLEVTPPLSDNVWFSYFGGQPLYSIQISNGLAMVSLFSEGLWMFEVKGTGYPTFTFFLRAKKREVEEQELFYINVVGVFRVGSPCIIKVTDSQGRTADGVIRVLDVGNPLGVVEGSNPLPYTPRSKSISVSFLRGGKEEASRTFSEVKLPGEPTRIPIAPAVGAAALAAFLFVWRKGFFKKVHIPR